MSPVADAAHVPTRPLAVYVLAIIALIIAVCVSILVLLGHRQSDLLRSARIASDYHLSSTTRAGVIEKRLWDADRHIRPPSDGVVPTADPLAVSMLSRTVHLVEREVRALETTQKQYADSTFDAPLRRLLDQSGRFRHAISTLQDGEPTTVVRDRLDQFRLRLDQFSGLHWTHYLAQDSSAARAAGWRRFSLLSIIVALAGLIPIGIATRQVFVTIRQHRAARRRQRLLMSELDHRVKNNLASVLSLADQTARTLRDLDEFARAFNGRIIAMARTHEALAGAEWNGIEVAQAASLTLATYLDADHAQVTVEGDAVLLPASTALPVCLVLHELATNAVKHGALGVPDGRVALSWATRDNRVELSWVELGGPVVVEPKTAGLGTQLIKGFVRHELRGELAIDYRPEGLECRISVPLTEEPTAGRRSHRHEFEARRVRERAEEPELALRS